MSMPSKETSHHYLQQTIDLAKQSPPKPTNFRVGCVIVAFPTTSASENTQGQVISTGYTLELPGNTHAEQCALIKLAEQGVSLSPDQNVVLYTSLEPCGHRLSGNLPCVQRIIETRQDDPQGGIRRVVFGAKEPGTFVKDSQSCQLLTEAGIEWEYLPEFEKEILSVAMEGHQKTQVADEKPQDVSSGTQGNTQQNQLVNEEEARRAEAAEAAPRNPKKRMMEAPPGSEAARS